MSASRLPTARLSPTRTRSTARRGGPGGGDPPPGPCVLERYRLQRRLGAGGFGTVWLAHDERLQREVAVKILPRERIVGGRFEREARAAARLSHPGIVTLYEAAIDDDGAYLVSELVRGGTLDVLLEDGRLSDRDVAALGIALCDALSHAHAQGVVHRDVKPSNILVPEHPTSAAGIAKLTDFGVARVLGGDSLTRTGDVVGTAAYMAPEQAEGLQAGAPADLYALALVIYEALTGVNPVRTGTAAHRARRLGAYLPPLRRQRRDLPRELGCAIDLALRPKARERGTLTELRQELSRALQTLDDEPGVVASAWPLARTEPRPVQLPAADFEAEPALPEPALPEPGVPEPAEEDGVRLPRWPARALAAAGAAASAGWLDAHLLAPPLLAPTALALIAGALTLLLPRLGYVLAGCALVGIAAADGRPGGALVLGLATILPVLLVPLSGTAWPLSAGAPALGLLGIGGAWPALAARLPRTWRRAALGACGWVWLLLASPLAGHGLYLRVDPGTPAPAAWTGSLSVTVDQVLRPLLGSGALAGALVWAAGAVVLPWLLRARSVPVRIALVCGWSAALVSATETAISLPHPEQALLGGRAALLGGVAAAVFALLPTALRAARVARAPARLS